MNTKLLNIILLLLILFSTCGLSKANAGLIIGDHYSDAGNPGIVWQYVGFFDLAAGPYWNDADDDMVDGDPVTPYNGLEVAEQIFGSLDIGSEYALSSNTFEETEAYLVNHKAWYDGFLAFTIQEMSESLVADIDGDGFYNTAGDVSAYVLDRAIAGENINHVFKTVIIPEPSTISIFAVILIALMAYRMKRNNKYKLIA